MATHARTASTSTGTAAKRAAAKKADAPTPEPVEKNEDKSWPWVTIIAVVVGIIAGIVWARIDFTQSINLGKSSLVIDYVFANSWFAAILFGLAFFALTWAILPRSNNNVKE